MVDAGAVRLGDGTVPAWVGLGEGAFYFDAADGNLYFRNSQTGAVTGPLGAGGSADPLPLASAFAPAPPASGILVYSKVFQDRVFSMEPGGFETDYALTGFATTLYVGSGGLDATAIPGSMTRQYNTVNGALAAASDGDTIKVGPGFFVSGPLNFGALVDITIDGSGIGVTRLDTNSLSPFIAPPVPFGTFRLLNLSVHSKNSSCVVLDGTGGGGAYMGTVVLHSLELLSDAASPLYMNFVAGLDISNVVARGGGVVSFDTVTFTQPCRDFLCQGSSFRLGWDEASLDKPAGGRTQMVFQNALISAPMHVRNQPDAIFFETCLVTRMTTDFGLTAIGGFAPKMKFYGTVEQYVSFPGGGAGLPDTATAQTWDFEGAIVKGDDGFGNAFDFGVDGAAVNFVNVNAANVRVDGAKFMTARDGIDMDCRGCGVHPQYGTIGTGLITPDQMAGTYFLANGAEPQAIALLPGSRAPRSVQVTLRRFLGVALNISDPQVDNFLAGSPCTFDLYYTGVAVIGTDLIEYLVTF